MYELVSLNYAFEAKDINSLILKVVQGVVSVFDSQMIRSRLIANS
jgi:hypothetical protein